MAGTVVHQADRCATWLGVATAYQKGNLIGSLGFRGGSLNIDGVFTVEAVLRLSVEMEIGTDAHPSGLGVVGW